MADESDESVADELRSVPIRVVLAEDHKLVREGIHELLEGEPDFTVVGEASTTEEAQIVVRREHPDVVLVDIQLPSEGGIALLRCLAAEMPETRAVVLSAYDDQVYVTEALEAGAVGYLLKTTSRHELVAAVRAVVMGATVFDREISRRALQPAPHQTREPCSHLTARELDVVRLIATSASNKQIALALGLGIRTVESYVSNVLTKLGLSSRTELALWAVRHHVEGGQAVTPGQ
ncbi:MAG: response regulator [Acidimicrobiales bacterium]